MALVLLGTDLFSLAIALELLTFAAVPLVCLDGRPGTVAAALRSLLFGLLGSGADPARLRAAARPLRHARHPGAGGADAGGAGDHCSPAR